MKHKSGQLMKLPDGKKIVFIPLLSSEGCISSSGLFCRQCNCV